MAERTESSIVIAADPTAIMAVIADLASYPQWSDGISTVEVLTTGEDGRPARARFQLSGVVRDTYELDYTWEGDHSVHWTLVRGDMLRSMDGAYDLTPAAGGTSVQYRLSVDLRIPMIGHLKRKAEKVIIETALKGLKQRVESPG